MWKRSYNISYSLSYIFNSLSGCHFNRLLDLNYIILTGIRTCNIISFVHCFIRNSYIDRGLCLSHSIPFIFFLFSNSNFYFWSFKDAKQSFCFYCFDIHFHNAFAKFLLCTFQCFFFSFSLKFLYYHYAVTIPTDCNSTFVSISLYETTIKSL